MGGMLGVYRMHRNEGVCVGGRTLEAFQGIGLEAYIAVPWLALQKSGKVTPSQRLPAPLSYPRKGLPGAETSLLDLRWGV